ncbi:Uncharacterised protein [Mycobacteroides abscessus subsp. abscessus]|nr:Uncharacterised protein [Mycobacteroides abscessus subsp. abscessus]
MQAEGLLRHPGLTPAHRAVDRGVRAREGFVVEDVLLLGGGIATVRAGHSLGAGMQKRPLVINQPGRSGEVLKPVAVLDDVRCRAGDGEGAAVGLDGGVGVVRLDTGTGGLHAYRRYRPGDLAGPVLDHPIRAIGRGCHRSRRSGEANPHRGREDGSHQQGSCAHGIKYRNVVAGSGRNLSH